MQESECPGRPHKCVRLAGGSRRKERHPPSYAGCAGLAACGPLDRADPDQQLLSVPGGRTPLLLLCLLPLVPRRRCRRSGTLKQSQYHSLAKARGEKPSRLNLSPFHAQGVDGGCARGADVHRGRRLPHEPQLRQLHDVHAAPGLCAPPRPTCSFLPHVAPAGAPSQASRPVLGMLGSRHGDALILDSRANRSRLSRPSRRAQVPKR